MTGVRLERWLSSAGDLLLLDEPTNHLDMESLEWLEKTLSAIDAAVILVAHERWFLEATTTAELDRAVRELARFNSDGTPSVRIDTP